MKDLKAVVLGAGDGTRLGQIGLVTNKHLQPVWDRPMIEWDFWHLGQIGIKDKKQIAVVVSKPYDADVRRYLGPEFTCIDQGEGDGIGNSVRCAREFVGNSPFVVHLGDQIYTESLEPHLQEWEKSGTQIHLILRWYERANRHTVVTVEGSRVVSLVEKPKEPEEGFVMVGMSFYRPEFMSVLDDLQRGYDNEYQLSDAISMALERGFSVSFSKLGGEWVDAGTPENLLDATLLMKKLSKDKVGGIPFREN